MSAAEGAPPGPARTPDGATRARRAAWLWDHSGRLAGLALGGGGFAAMVFLAAIGFRPALYLVVLLVAGVTVIAVGGRIRGR
ncbi:MAG: hypothetical protein M0Z33_09570 [Actinomycetota bacterium]|nr:hypothetical protein [Actinomycetota bacterium]